MAPELSGAGALEIFMLKSGESQDFEATMKNKREADDTVHAVPALLLNGGLLCLCLNAVSFFVPDLVSLFASDAEATGPS